MNQFQTYIDQIEKTQQQINNIQVSNWLEKYKQQLIKTTQNINNKILIVKSIEFIDKNLILQLNTLSQQPNTKLKDISILFYASKLQIITQMLPHINNKSLDSIISQEDYLKNDNIHIIQVENPIKTQEQLAKFYQRLNLGHAYVNAGRNTESEFAKFFVKNYKAIFYLVSKEETQIEAMKVLINPDIMHVLTLWRIIDESKIVKLSYSQQLDKVKHKKIIHIPRLFGSITLDSLETNQLISLPSNLLFSMAFTDIRVKHQSKVRVRILSQQQVFKNNVDANSIRRVINNLKQSQQLTQPIQSQIVQVQDNAFFSMSCCGPRQSSKNFKIKNVIIHIHGGGFISMSSFSHQAYTRKWALSETIVFSIDYRLAPEHQFPSQLEDCWQAYMWIVHFAREFLNTDCENIILIGDSAGGNLCMGVLYRAIQLEQRLPDAIILAYPALNMNIQDFTLSSLRSLIDQMVPHSFLLMCQKYYVREGIDLKNIYLSPIYADIKILEKIPKKISIFCGIDDVLRDQSVEFVEKLAKIHQYEKPILTIIEDLPHGFLNMVARPDVIDAAVKGLQIVTDQLKAYLI
ncbi:hypothetical protein pb186bvf_000494 [Paramecium bursaria]